MSAVCYCGEHDCPSENWSETQCFELKIKALQDKYKKAVIHATDEESQKWAAIQRAEKAVDCGADSVCGMVGQQCQKCLRNMFHREVGRADIANAVLKMLLDGPGLCLETCESYCGFGHLKGCGAIKEFLFDYKYYQQGGEAMDMSPEEFKSLCDSQTAAPQSAFGDHE